jgi:hypothetical protein
MEASTRKTYGSWLLSNQTIGETMKRILIFIALITLQCCSLDPVFGQEKKVRLGDKYIDSFLTVAMTYKLDTVKCTWIFYWKNNILHRDSGYYVEVGHQGVVGVLKREYFLYPKNKIKEFDIFGVDRKK